MIFPLILRIRRVHAKLRAQSLMPALLSRCLSMPHFVANVKLDWAHTHTRKHTYTHANYPHNTRSWTNLKFTCRRKSLTPLFCIILITLCQFVILCDRQTEGQWDSGNGRSIVAYAMLCACLCMFNYEFTKTVTISERDAFVRLTAELPRGMRAQLKFRCDFDFFCE